MKFLKLLPGLSALTLAALMSTSAQAGYVVLDGIQLVSPGTAGTVTNIGRINLVSGGATVEQEINGGGDVFLGAEFRESGQIFTVTYTTENSPGINDTGALGFFNEIITISFSNVAGMVTALDGMGGFEFNFTSGDFAINGSAGLYATGSIIGIGGNANATNVVGGFDGNSALLGQVLALLGGFGFNDSDGNSLNDAIENGDVLFETLTNNQFNGAGESIGQCSFDATATCVTFTVTSGGDAFLVRDIPEPNSLALVGLALLGGAAATRRKTRKA